MFNELLNTVFLQHLCPFCFIYANSFAFILSFYKKALTLQ